MFKRFILAVPVFLLIGCSQVTAPASQYCPVPVHASAEVKAWLQSKEPLPSPVKQYFKIVGDQQAAIESTCR